MSLNRTVHAGRVLALGLVCLLGTVAAVRAKEPVVAAKEVAAKEAAGKEPDRPSADWRPRVHFSAGPLWSNDPNGPILLQGQYHLFYQSNPFGDEWGNMSWGHTVSADLVHWTKLPVALPATEKIMNFSGSVVEDRRNSSGLCGEANPSGHPCLVAVYTGFSKDPKGGDRQNQNVAASSDGGLSWTPYARNPVLDLGLSNFRDPKVFWHEPSRSWVMAVVLSEMHSVRIYRSKDLKNWTYASSFGPAGATGGAWECPDLMNLDVKDAKGNKIGSHWVMSVNLNPGGVAGGSGNQYFLGQFDGTKFVEDHPVSPERWVDWGKDFYASTSFAEIPANEDRLWIAWMNNWNYADKTPSLPGRGEMTLARHVYLRQDDMKAATKPLVLVQEPVLPLATKEAASGLLSIDDANARFAQGGPKSGVYMIRTTLVSGGASEVGVRLRRGTLKADEPADEETVVGVDRAKGQIFVDRRRSGYVSFSPNFPARTVAPMKHPEAKDIPIEIVVDRDSIEVFAEGGETVLTNLIFPSDLSRGLAFYAIGSNAAGDAAGFNHLEVVPLD